MIDDATRIGVTALKQQMEQARICAERMAATTMQAAAGVFHDFQSELRSRPDTHGVPLGFSTFSDGPSTAQIVTTDDHPPRPNAHDRNRVMQVDLDVTGWAGVVKVFENAAFDTWISYDWSEFDALTFWLYGNNTGTVLFFDVLDNRNPCSTTDDAERYSITLADDFSGWKLITVPFADMTRKETGNGAPDDGLGLTRVHGWGFGATATKGPVTYFLDDLALRRSSSD
jgi:hypothetical protein